MESTVELLQRALRADFQSCLQGSTAVTAEDITGALQKAIDVLAAAPEAKPKKKTAE